MISTDIDGPIKFGIDEKNDIIQEYEAVVESLKQDLKECNIEQTKLRNEIEILKAENKNEIDRLKQSFSLINDNNELTLIDNDGNVNNNKECIDNLKRQIDIIQLEKDSMFQLWQMSLKAVDVLEKELNSIHNDGINNKYYEEQMNNIKGTYSEAIKLLEEKLIQVRDNFNKHQLIWNSSKEQIDKLNNEKKLLEDQLIMINKQLLMNDNSNKQIVEIFKTEIQMYKDKLNKLEKDLLDNKSIIKKLLIKDDESKSKVAEALELIEIAMKEKDIILQRENQLINDKSNLEIKLNNLNDELTMDFNKQFDEMKSNYDKNIKKYNFEIKELKIELKEKITTIDRVQREYRLLEEEFDKKKLNSNDYLNKSCSKVIELEQQLKDVNYKLEINEESVRRKFDEKIRQSESKIMELEEKLSHCNDRLKRYQVYNVKEMEDRIREADERVKEAVDRYSNLEKRLSRTLDERENLSSELRSLQISTDRETIRKDNERRLLESRIRELQENLRLANESVDKSNTKVVSLNNQIELLENELHSLKNQRLKIDKHQTLDEDKPNFNAIQEKYEERISELNRHVKIHQKLSNKWKEEAESLAIKFQNRYKELRAKINILKQENNELNKELILSRQQIALCRAQFKQKFDPDDAS